MHIKISGIPFSILFLAVLLITSCQTDEDKNIPDVSNIAANVKILRFEQDLFNLDTNNLVQGLQNLESKYPQVSDRFFDEIISAKQPNQTPPQYLDMIRQFLTDSIVRKTADTTQIVFKNFEPLKKELEEAGRFYKYYFPNRPDLTFITFVSQYNYDAFLFGRDSIGIGLDFFLGENHADYNFMETLRYAYVKRTLTKEHLATKAMRLQIAAMAAGTEGGSRLLDIMIYNGKQLYILDKLLPNTPDSIKFGYTAAQTTWTKENESGIWASLLKNNVLYESNLKKIAKLVTLSPNSPGMPPEAPGETANYIGWQIIKQYMKRNPNITLQELLSLQDAQMILDKSKYKPAR